MTRADVLVTREETRSGPLSRALSARGMRVRTLALLATLPPEDPAPLQAAIDSLADFDWLIAASPRGARAFLERLPAGEAARPRLAVVGPGTARPFRAVDWRPEITGSGGGVELVARLRETPGGLDGVSILVPAADRIRAETLAALEEAGARVTVVTAYRTAEAPGAVDALRTLLAESPPDAVAFTSPSAVEVFAKAEDAIPAGRFPRCAAIGQTTADAVSKRGWADPIVPRAPGLESLAEAMADALAAHR